MAIPEGYRLLTAEDIGKVFGVDLETTVYIDTGVSLSMSEDYFVKDQTTNLTNFLQASNLYDPGYEWYIPRIDANLNYNLIWEGSVGWIINSDYDPVSASEGLEVTSFNTDYSWNNWFYVKDIVNPYSIKIKNKEGIKLLTKDKKLTDDVTVTIDESLLGGGSSGGVDLDYGITFCIRSNSFTFGSGFSYSLDYGNTWQYTEPSSDPDEIYSYAAFIEANKGFQSSGDYISTEKFACILVRFSTAQASVDVRSNAGCIKLYGDNSYQVYLLTADSYAYIEVTLSASGGGSD